MQHILINPPLIFTMQLIWESNAENAGEIRATMDAVQEVGCLHIIFLAVPFAMHMSGWACWGRHFARPSEVPQSISRAAPGLHSVQNFSVQVIPATLQSLCPWDLCSETLVRPTALQRGDPRATCNQLHCCLHCCLPQAALMRTLQAGCDSHVTYRVVLLLAVPSVASAAGLALPLKSAVGRGWASMLHDLLPQL